METVSFIHMASSAGISACIAEILTLPIDTAKVRMQVASAHPGAVAGRPPGFVPVLARMVKDEGISAWWKGLPAGLHRQFVYATLRISMYPHIRDFYSKQNTSKMIPELGIKILAGMSSGAIGMTIANPTDVVKVRLQSAITAMAASGAKSQPPKHTVYTGAMHAYSTIIKEEGIFGLWRGLAPNIARNAIVCAVRSLVLCQSEMVAYDELKGICLQYFPDTFAIHCMAGFGAGFIATVTGSPIDVVKTRYMNARPGVYSGVGHAFVTLAKEAGVLGFYKGNGVVERLYLSLCVRFAPNVLRVGSFNMLVFLFYEQILKRLNNKSHRNGST